MPEAPAPPAAAPPSAPLPALFAAREARLALLDQLPRSLWLGGLTHSHGTLEPRLQALQTLRTALAAGRWPAAADCAGWLPAPLDAALRATAEALALPGYCAGRTELADTVTHSALFHLDFIVDYRDRGADEARAIALAVDSFRADWEARCGEMNELVEIFGDLGDLPKHQRWDALRGLLRSSDWQEVVRIRRLLEELPELRRLLQSLGRSQPVQAPAPRSLAPTPRPQPALQPEFRQHTLRVPELPGQTRGVCRSDRIARMLPAEAMLLGHPTLRLVWHARRAERTLLAYEDDDHLQESRPHPRPRPQPELRPRPGPRHEAGPLLLCVDSSGSMRGGAETVAKAVVLEAVRVAHAQGRPCQVFTFGGSDEVLELELPVSLEGITRLTRFLAQGFGGGTDICGPLERCLERVEQQAWRQADLLLASDGEFGATPALAARLEDARARLGLHVEGVLIGDRETIGLLEISDHIHWVREWRRFGHHDGGSPVHSARLTATYFPGALRNADNRAATVDGATAAAAIRRGQPLPSPRAEPLP